MIEAGVVRCAEGEFCDGGSWKQPSQSRDVPASRAATDKVEKEADMQSARLDRRETDTRERPSTPSRRPTQALVEARIGPSNGSVDIRRATQRIRVFRRDEIGGSATNVGRKSAKAKADRSRPTRTLVARERYLPRAPAMGPGEHTSHKRNAALRAKVGQARVRTVPERADEARWG